MTEKIKSLTDYQHARLRTEMFLGSREIHEQNVFIVNKGIIHYKWVPAIFTAIREIIDNAVDEIINFEGGRGNKISVKIENSVIEVSDNGRGIPIEWRDDLGDYTVTAVLTRTKTGRNFDEDRGHVAGMNGLGASIVTFCSEWMEVEVTRDGKHFFQRYEEGGDLFDDLVVYPPKIQSKKGKTGTTIRFKLSDKVFKNYIIPTDLVETHLTFIAFSNSTKKIFFNGKQLRPSASTFTGGKEHVEINLDGEIRGRILFVPNYFEDESCQFFGTVNSILTFNGGTHVESIKNFLSQTLLQGIQNELKRNKLSATKSDCLQGCAVFYFLEMDNPSFDSQTKSSLVSNVVSIFREAFNRIDPAKVVRKIPGWKNSLIERLKAKQSKKDLEEIQKYQKKNKKRTVQKLLDATSKRRSETVLIIAEGDSAISSLAYVRNPKIHAGMPLRGKIINVRNTDVKKVLQNSELVDLMSSIGLEIGKNIPPRDLRYGQIWIAHDMDPDGFSIGGLLINFFYTFWPHLFTQDKPYIYVLMTPYIIAQKGKKRLYWYGHNYDEFDPEEYKGWEITRAKGLGSLTAEDWKHILQKPVLFPLVDDGKLEESLDLIFNDSRSDDRKKWMATVLEQVEDAD